jgi:hypothetical protein
MTYCQSKNIDLSPFKEAGVPYVKAIELKTNLAIRMYPSAVHKALVVHFAFT